jgi:hypothetical protein
MSLNSTNHRRDSEFTSCKSPAGLSLVRRRVARQLLEKRARRDSRSSFNLYKTGAFVLGCCPRLSHQAFVRVHAPIDPSCCTEALAAKAFPALPDYLCLARVVAKELGVSDETGLLVIGAESGRERMNRGEYALFFFSLQP